MMKATLWKKVSSDGFGGSAYSTPQIIECEYYKKTKTDFSKNGKNMTFNFSLYHASDIEVGDYIALSEETSISPYNALLVVDLVETPKIALKVAYL